MVKNTAIKSKVVSTQGETKNPHKLASLRQKHEGPFEKAQKITEGEGVECEETP